MLAWSTERDIYELHDTDQVTSVIAAFWESWLDAHVSFSFKGRNGRLNLLKEQRRAGTGYWYAYRNQGKRTAKRYAGRSRELTFARLEALAQAFAHTSEQQGIAQPQRGVKAQGDSDGSAKLETLLAPKFQPPRLHSSLLRRSRLLAQLEAGYECKLILISAPAGFGKTSLARQWLDEAAQRNPAPTVA